MAKKKKEETSANGRTYYTPEQIIEAWQGSDTAAEAIERLGGQINERTLAARVFNLRKKGVPLKRIGRARGKKYTDEYLNDLKELAESLA